MGAMPLLVPGKRRSQQHRAQGGAPTKEPCRPRDPPVRPHRPRLQRLPWTDVLALLAFTTVMMTAAILRFRKRLD
jgi:hypothetical protein